MRLRLVIRQGLDHKAPLLWQLVLRQEQLRKEQMRLQLGIVQVMLIKGRLQ